MPVEPNYNKRRATPPLPPELLLRIFHYATYVPGTLVPDIYDNASILGPIFIEKFHPALQEALIIKRAIVHVCRAWWYIAAPILYDSIYICSARCLSSLHSTLERSAEGKGMAVGTRPLGEYTQRLDIAIHDFAEEADAEYDLLEELITYMPRLSIFSISSNEYPDLPYSVLSGLSSSSRDSLRVIDWSSPNLELPVSLIRQLLDNCTQLRVLNCPKVPWSWETDQVVIPSTVITLRLCTLVRVGSVPTPNLKAPPAPLPALQELVLDFSRDDCDYDYFFNTYGPQLVSVHLYEPEEFEDELYPSLCILAQTCPNLRRLTITLNDVMGFAGYMYSDMFESSSESSSDSVPITNTYLGLRIYYSSRLDFSTLFNFLEYLMSRMPSLQVVQLLDERYVQCLLGMHTELAVRALRCFTEANATVRLEDKDGVLLTDRLKALGYL